MSCGCNGGNGVLDTFAQLGGYRWTPTKHKKKRRTAGKSKKMKGGKKHRKTHKKRALHKRRRRTHKRRTSHRRRR